MEGRSRHGGNSGRRIWRHRAAGRPDPFRERNSFLLVRRRGGRSSDLAIATCCDGGAGTARDPYLIFALLYSRKFQWRSIERKKKPFFFFLLPAAEENKKSKSK
jgi:hypothetical protein